jgi:hypothetical protein
MRFGGQCVGIEVTLEEIVITDRDETEERKALKYLFLNLYRR